MNVTQRWRLKTERAGWFLDQPESLRIAKWLVPILFGLLSISMRQDSNWDLRNYHLYNPFAWLNGKVGLDLAPAQMQSYFNPTIDLLYYGLNKIFPAWLTGFVMGLVHGLNFLVLVGIARETVPAGVRGRQIRLPLCLAFAGMLAAGFIAQLGNTMGDNLTALFVLSSVLVILRHWRAFGQSQGLAQLLLAGLAMGLGVGLKLTNGIYAPALCLALLMVPSTVAVRLRAAFLFGVGVLAGISVTAGHWFWKMWTVFGNPLYPQFNNIFHSPMAGPVSIGDTRFMPHGFAEKALWPFIFALHPQRISEIKLSMLVWPILYVAFIVLACFSMVRRRSNAATTDAVNISRDTALLTFFALSYLTWLNLFSIHRYLTPLELVAPVIVWLIAHRLFSRVAAGKIAAIVILIIVACSVPSKNWGRVSWGAQAFGADVPVIANPAQSIVLTVHADPPMGWLATFFPADLAFVSLATGFDSDTYLQRFRDMMAHRKGPIYVMVSDSGAVSNPRLNAEQRQKAISMNAVLDRDAGLILAGRGLRIAKDSCALHHANVGNQILYYRFCRAESLVPAAADVADFRNNH